MNMLIRKKRIRSLAANLGPVRRGSTIIPAVKQISRFSAELQRTGFSNDLTPGERVLPTPVGKISLYNAEGKEIIHKDKPKETVYHQRLWEWEEWHGPYDRVPRSKIVDIPYKRYPRTFMPPPSIELELATDSNSNLVVIGPRIEYYRENEELLLHVINLFLELFGECWILAKGMSDIITAPVRRLNWQVLPRGRRPWNQLEPELQPLIKQKPRVTQAVIVQRFKTINKYEPDFVALGQAGFNGYVIFGFPDKNLYVLESIHRDNATYVFEEEWEELSKKTKAEILSDSLQTDRLIHREGWPRKVRQLLGVG